MPRPRNVLALALTLGLASHAPAQDKAEAPTRDKVFVGYVFGSTRGIDFTLYTHLCHAFLVADAEGNVQKRGNVPDPKLVEDAHKAGVKVLLSLGGWGWDKQFAAIVEKPEAEARYVSAVLEAVNAAGYDGIDLDWEYPDNEKEVVGFERLTRTFRARLDALGAKTDRKMLVTMAASSNPGTLKWLGKDFLLETMDWVNVMTYDYAGEWLPYAGHNAPLESSKKAPGAPRSVALALTYLLNERGIPADRLALGIPLYGRGFSVKEPYASTKGVTKTRLPQGNFSNLDKLRAERGWKRVWDDETKTPWLLAPDGSAVFGYDDAESVALKTDWAVAHDLRGVFFWQVAADKMPDGTHPLQEAARKALDAGVKKAER